MSDYGVPPCKNYSVLQVSSSYLKPSASAWVKVCWDSTLPYYYLPWTCPDVLWSCATAGHSVHMTIELDSCTAWMRSWGAMHLWPFLFIYGARLVFLILLGVISLALETIAWWLTHFLGRARRMLYAKAWQRWRHCGLLSGGPVVDPSIWRLYSYKQLRYYPRILVKAQVMAVEGHD